jgi:hypothetical protein
MPRLPMKDNIFLWPEEEFQSTDTGWTRRDWEKLLGVMDEMDLTLEDLQDTFEQLERLIGKLRSA